MRARELRAAAGVLARAFDGDPLFRHALPDARARRLLPWLFAGSLRHCRRHGGVVVQRGERGAGVAAWVPIEHVAMSLTDLTRAHLLTTPLRVGPRAMQRMLAHEGECERRIRVVAGREPQMRTAYLWVVGVEPDAVGTGLGGRVVNAVLRDMARSGHHRCVLKTEQPRNVAFYEHLGFRVEDTFDNTASDLPVWIFARDTTPSP